MLKVGTLTSSEPGSAAEKHIKKLKKSLKVDKVYDWDTTYPRTNPLSSKFVPEHDVHTSIMKKNDGYTKQEKDHYEEEAETEFGAFDKDEPKPMYADGVWKGCTRLSKTEFVNTTLHHQLKIRSCIDVETKPALHSDFTQVQTKIKNLNLPAEATLLTVGKLMLTLGPALELLNHSNQLNDHLYCLTNPSTLSPEAKSALAALRFGAKINRICSTALLMDILEIFNTQYSFHNMGKRAFVKWASDFILKYNLWGSKKPDRV